MVSSISEDIFFFKNQAIKQKLKVKEKLLRSLGKHPIYSRDTPIYTQAKNRPMLLKDHATVDSRETRAAKPLVNRSRG